MMARGHLLSGALAGTGVCAALAAAGAPVLVRGVCWALTAAAVLLPDIDSRKATIVRLLGPLGVALHHLTVEVGRTLYDHTATAADDGGAGDGHRLISHTAAAAVGTGAATAGISAGLGPALALSTEWGQGWGQLAGKLGEAWSAGPGAWWWCWGIAVGVGHFVGVLGDTLTVKGAPLWWPLTIEGRRWYPVTSPVPFRAGKSAERHLVVPLLYVGLGAAVLGLLGAWGPLIEAGRALIEGSA